MDIDRPLVRKRIEECRAGAGLIKSWKVDGRNAFIQLYLEGLRINFFLPTPDDVVESPPHTHDLGFTSTILYGSFTNTLLSVEDAPDGDYEKLRLHRPDALTFKYTKTGQRCCIVSEDSTTYGVGDTYSMDPREYHTTLFEVPTITYMRRWQEERIPTYHLVEPGSKVPSFPDRTISAAELPAVWRTLDEMCSLAGI